MFVEVVYLAKEKPKKLVLDVSSDVRNGRSSKKTQVLRSLEFCLWFQVGPNAV